ncbi:MAG: dephospho-CoA kinase [Chloroflexi bacterium]|nr:dephospho-CoA kinase [Chloroflexota bacterium]|tara:strand:- start:16212 stop:16799 length:588 start_codon:yes stop_codon:yes gene_type:complete
MFVLGITGFIGSGKSEVCKFLINYGFQVIELDKLAHQSYEIGTDIYLEIINFFGSEVLNSDMTINREKLGDIVFKDKDKLIFLQNLVWPKITNELRIKLQNYKKNFYEKISIESSLLFSGGWHKFCDQIWFVESSKKNIKLRLKNFRGMGENKINSILELQSFVKQNKEQVDQVIINNKNLLNLKDIIKRNLKVV